MPKEQSYEMAEKMSTRVKNWETIRLKESTL